MKIAITLCLFLLSFVPFISAQKEQVIQQSNRGSFSSATEKFDGNYIKVSGLFENKQDATDRINCFCNRGGYITNAKGTRIPVCLDKLGKKKIDCTNVAAKGKYITYTSKRGGACAKSTMDILELVSVECISDDGNTPEEVTVSGSFRSFTGVMNPLSCYCYNVGTITTKSGERVNVCFKNVEIHKDPKKCDNLTVTGSYKNISIKDNGPCPAGTKKLLMVSKYSCR
ncbi:MAG: hypothetical protein MK212_15970 [Saprospiraceae bacterium]|nr:hypothetical protein [Saprospiraceae bacterium]